VQEQEFSSEGVADMLALALVGQGVEIVTQEDLAELVRQGEPVPRRLALSQAPRDGGIGFAMLKYRTAQHVRRQRKVIEGRAHVVGQCVRVRDGCPGDDLEKVLARTLSIRH
jgi:hypothetical protein